MFLSLIMRSVVNVASVYLNVEYTLGILC